MSTEQVIAAAREVLAAETIGQEYAALEKLRPAIAALDVEAQADDDTCLDRTMRHIKRVGKATEKDAT